MLILGHLHLEAELKRLIRSAVPRPQSLPKMSFNTMVGMASALGCIPDDTSAGLRCVNSLRNAFAHEIGREIEPAGGGGSSRAIVREREILTLVSGNRPERFSTPKKPCSAWQRHGALRSGRIVRRHRSPPLTPSANRSSTSSGRPIAACPMGHARARKQSIQWLWTKNRPRPSSLMNP